jgi:hypothetical protein
MTDLNKEKRDKAIDVFSKYSFQDEQGNPLESCLDFAELLYQTYPILISEVTKDGRTLIFNSPISFHLEFDFSQGLIITRCLELDFYAHSQSLSTLVEKLEEDIFLTWDEYIYDVGKILPNPLPDDLQKIKNRLVKRIHEKNDNISNK